MPRPIGAAAALSVMLACAAAPAQRADTAHGVRIAYRATDTLGAPRSLEDDDERAAAQLAALRYAPVAFDVTVTEREPGADGDHAAIVAFPSPRPGGDAIVDRVVCEWFRPRRAAEGDDDRAVPAVVLVHILDGRLLLERAAARALAVHGVHAFVMHLPGYQARRDGPGRPGVRDALVYGRQGIADARRARDAVAALPGVDGDRVSLMGISLGAILGASTAALDGAFADSFLFLAGGDLRALYRDGELEVAKMRRDVARAGMSEDEIHAALDGIDPLPLAHRLPARRTWLWSAKQDPVVPPANARALASAAQLDEDHHLWFAGTHHSGVLNLPEFVRQVARRALTGEAPEPLERR